MPRTRHLVAAPILAAGLLLASAARAADDLDAYLETVRARDGLPALAAAVTRGGEIIASGAVGVRARGIDIPVTLEDRFHIGSDTKALTATVAGALVDAGLLRWDSTVGEVLGDKVPDMNPALAAVTLEQLLSHASGIPSDTPEIKEIYFSVVGYDKNTFDWRIEAINQWKHHAPKVPAGSPFQYANFGYMIAGAMLETAAGRPWERLVVERIYEPLGLTSAGFGPQASFGRYDAAIGHSVGDDGKVTPMFWGTAADVPALLGPAGNAHMSILDFARWAGWNAGAGKRPPHIVSPETLAVIHRPHVTLPPIPNPPPGTPAGGAYGFGWGTVKFAWADAPLLTHTGSNSMNLAMILVDPARDLAIVTATNLPGASADKAARDVLQRLYETYRQ